MNLDTTKPISNKNAFVGKKETICNAFMNLSFNFESPKTANIFAQVAQRFAPGTKIHD